MNLANAFNEFWMTRISHFLSSMIVVAMISCSATPPKFLERHPKIEKLQVSMISMGGLGLLPNLRHFHGYALDYLKLCTNRPPPVQCLEINLHRLSEEEELCLVNGLANTKTLTQLALTDYLKSTVSLVFLASITKACPELTHFKCALGNEKSMDLIYSTIFRSLPNLEHLRLQFEYASDPDVEILYSSHLQGLASRHPLKTLQIDILIDSVEQTKWEFFYFMKDNNRIIPAPKLDANRFDWF
ncbi:hypothetical protein BT96DRAFT_995030 [Gymnopus androsaceus JB14]|uniref:F-box domain-containing protein n=1 Tax=Gymnopus androsaceus JB14 TaxID=1447944 RepID=A0A6A4HLJ0_9AGAR|nr:hypothetical protein BT96DRAFT_995030 [Gymnopus androsaceus JB14]